MAADHLLTFGGVLKQYREAAGLTQEALAERAGLSVQGISALERGVNRAPRPETLQLLAGALGLSPREYALFDAAARGKAEQPPVLSRSFQGGEDPPYAATARPPGDGSPPFVGRERELAVLERHRAGSLEGSPVALVLAGEPGIGKTRLLREAGAQARQSGWCVLQGGCQRRGGQEPYAPLLGALEQHIRAQAPLRLRADLRGCAWLVRLLPELADGPIEPLPAWTLTPEQERRLMFGAVARYLSNVAGPSGTLLVLDDMQWAGVDALDLLGTLIRSASEKALRVVGAYRDVEVQPLDDLAVFLADLAHAGLARQRLLGPLASAEAERLLRTLLGGIADDAPAFKEDSDLQGRLLQRAGGVPFFLVSFAQELRDGGLEGEASDSVSWDLAHSLRQRVAALTATAQEVLGVAAVAGREASRALLTSVVGRPQREVLAALSLACRARLLEEVGPERYRFAHDVIREVVEADLGAAQRMLLHHDIAWALESTWQAEGGSGEALVEALAYHYGRTDDHQRAAHWLEQAGDQARAGFANATALVHYAAAREHQMGATTAAARSRLDEKIGDLHMLTGAYAAAQEDFARARAEVTDAARRAELWCKEGITWDKRGEFAQALAAFDAAEAEGRPWGGAAALPGAVRLQMEVNRGELYFRQGDLEAVEQAMQRAHDLLDAEPDSRVRDQAAFRISRLIDKLYWARSDYERHAEHIQHTAALVEKIGDQQLIGIFIIEQSMMFHRVGDWAKAEDYIRRGLAAAECVGDLETISFGWLHLGGVAEQRGDLGAAEECYGKSLALQERSGDQWGIANSWFSRGRVALLRGDLHGAEEYDRQALALFEHLGDEVFLAAGWNALGNVVCEQGDPRTADGLYRRARRVARQNEESELEAVAALAQARTRLRGASAGSLSRTRLRAVTALLAHARTLTAVLDSQRPAVWAALLTAELYVRQGAWADAQATAEEAQRMAGEGGWRIEGAQARRLLGQCVHAGGNLAAAESRLREALATFEEMGAALEADRTRMALARILATQTGTEHGMAEARALLAQAQAGFSGRGAAWDLASAEQLAATWAAR